MAGRFTLLLSRGAQLSLVDWEYLLVAAKELFIARIQHAVRPAGEILHDLQASPHHAITHNQVKVLSTTELTRISWALGAAAARVPWRSDCLLRVMAADRWLHRLQIQPDFFLGVARSPTGEFMAHAWLRCGEFTVTGGSSDEFSRLLEPGIELEPVSDRSIASQVIK